MTGLSLLLALVLGVAAWTGLRDDTYVASRPQSSDRVVDPAAAARTLQDLERAITRRDTSAAKALAPDNDQVAAQLLGSLVDNARSLRVRGFTLRYVDELGAPASAGDWDAAVDVTWQLAGFDRTAARAEVRFGFTVEDGEVAVTTVGGGDRRSPLWLTAAVEVRRTPTTLVLVAGSPAAVDSYARRAVAAVPVVRRVLPRWRPRLVVEVPASADGLHAALAAEPGTYEAIAAVTTTVDGSTASDAPVHVLVNPEVFDRLEPAGAQVVMSHEATHVATTAPRSAMPVWLLEGFADYVALRDVDLPLTTTAAQIIDQVQRRGPPRELPGPAEFDTETLHLGAVYESAWLVCRVLADRSGEAALLRLYERLDDGAPVTPALRQLFGLDRDQLVRLWRQRLSDLAA